MLKLLKYVFIDAPPFHADSVLYNLDQPLTSCNNMVRQIIQFSI